METLHIDGFISIEIKNKKVCRG